MRGLHYPVITVSALFLVSAGAGPVADRAICPVVSAGASTDGLTGSLQNTGQAVIGVASNGIVTARLGAIRCYAGEPVVVVAGDCDDDRDVDLADFDCFFGCVTDPGEGGISTDCDAFDFDDDLDVDLLDFAGFQAAFTG